MDENILFSYELKDAWFLPIAGVEVYKTGEVRCMTGDEDRTSILDEKALAEIENVIESHPELFEYESPEIATPSILQVFDTIAGILTRNGVPSECLALR